MVLAVLREPRTNENQTYPSSVPRPRRAFGWGIIFQTMLTAAAFQPKGFEGVMLAASLNDVIQMECLAMSTRAVRVDRGDRSGRIFFAGGQVVHAEVGALTGEEAFFEITHWTKGAFQIEEGVRAMDETITRNWETLLMESAQRHDESATTVTAFPLPAPAPAQTEAMHTHPIVEIFKDPEILGAVLYSPEGEVLISKGEAPEDLQGTAAYVLQLLAHIGTALGADNLREVQLSGTEQRALFLNTPEHHVAAMTNPKTNLATLAKKLTNP